ncbi:MAG: hypothetical protein ACYCWW_19890 [Deltaproteobacteria bacterium]
MTPSERHCVGALAALLLATPLGCKNGNGGPDAGSIDGPTGLVTFAQHAPRSPGDPETYGINACFWSGISAATEAAGIDAGVVANPCQGTTEGGCCVSATDPGVTDTGCAEENLDVGPVEILIDGADIGTLHFDGGTYTLEALAPLAWHLNDRLEAKGGGVNGFPTFDVTVGAVAPVAVTAPAPTLALPVVSRDRALSVTWTPSGDGYSDAWIEATDPTTGDLESVDCPAMGDVGRQLLSPAALGQLPANGLGLIEVWHANRRSFGAIEAESRSVAESAMETR